MWVLIRKGVKNVILNVSRVQFQNQFPTNIESISDFISGNSDNSIELIQLTMKMRTNLL